MIKVTVSSMAVTPRARITGPSVVTVKITQALSLFASALLPPCAEISNVPLSYTWSVYINGRHSPSLSKSISLDPRNFKLPAYTLDAAVEYYVQVVVSAPSIRDAQSSSTSVKVSVSRSGVMALINGGSSRKVSLGGTASTAFVVDASSSYDIDYPTIPSRLSYGWACIIVSPSYKYGQACGFSTAALNTSIISIPSSNFVNVVEDTSYQFTVFVTNILQDKASASTTITVTTNILPIVSIDSSALKVKYNTDQKLQFSALITTVGPAQALWSSSSLSSSKFAGILLTPMNISIPAPASTSSASGATTRFTSFALAIAPNSLIGGLSYTFTIGAYYGTNPSNSAYSSFTVLMNSPPLGGYTSGAPLNGSALTDMFVVSTFGWNDDPSDYPLSAILFHSTRSVPAL